MLLLPSVELARNAVCRHSSHFDGLWPNQYQVVSGETPKHLSACNSHSVYHKQRLVAARGQQAQAVQPCLH